MSIKPGLLFLCVNGHIAHCACAVTWPCCRGSKIAGYLEFPTPIYLFTIQLLWCSDDD